MYEPVKYKKLNELIAELKQEIQAIDSGQAGVDEIESATDLSRELYERLLVLRYKAYDSLMKSDAPASISFRVPEKPVIPPNQTSLIDVIQEITGEADEEKAPEPEIIPPTPTPLPTPQPTPVVHTPKPQTATAAAPSLHDKLTKEFGGKETLSDKLEHSPIADLKKAISLNQRFQFSRELFKGNNQDYEVAIEKLNTANRAEAMKHLETLRSKYNWSPDSAVVSDFTELVERRHA